MGCSDSKPEQVSAPVAVHKNAHPMPLLEAESGNLHSQPIKKEERQPHTIRSQTAQSQTLQQVSEVPAQKPLHSEPLTADMPAEAEIVPQPTSVPLPLKGEEADESRGGRLKFKAEELVTPKGNYNPRAEQKKSLLKTTSYVGTALLSLAKKHPKLQAIAFMLGAVTAQAVAACSLRIDCARLAKVLAQVEITLVKLGSSASAQMGALDELSLILDDAMKILLHLKRPYKRGIPLPEVAKIAQTGALSKIRDRLMKAIKALDDGGWLSADELSSINQASFKESRAVASHDIFVDENGFGRKDRANGKGEEEEEEGRDSGGDGPSYSPEEVAGMVDEMVDAEDVKDILDTPQKEPIMSFDIPPPLSTRPTPDEITPMLMHNSVADMKALSQSRGMDLSQVTKRYPLPPMEGERLAYVKQHRLEGVWTEVVVTDILTSMRELLKAAYCATYVIGYQSNHLIESQVDGALLGKEPGTIVRQQGRIQARKYSLCQHTVASNLTHVRVPLERLGECFDHEMFDDQLLCKADEGVADQAQRLATPGKDPLIEEFVVLVKTGAQLAAAGLQIQHLGVPVRLDGLTVGTICILHPPDTWNAAAEVAVLKGAAMISSRIAEAVNRRTQEQLRLTPKTLSYL